MKSLLCIFAALLLLPCAVLAADGFSLTVTNSKAANQRRYVTIDVRVSDNVSLTNQNTLLVVVAPITGGGHPDQFGPPQNFALKGTSHEVGKQHYRVEVALPMEKARVKFMLVDKKKVLYEQTRDI